MNRKVRRVDTTRRTTVFHSITRLAVFILKLLYAGCVRSADGAHSCARQSSSHSIGLTRCGDRPGGKMPAGMSRNCAPFAKERQYYTLSRRWAQRGKLKTKPRHPARLGKRHDGWIPANMPRIKQNRLRRCSAHSAWDSPPPMEFGKRRSCCASS